jgi:hypothetical protein
MAVTACLDPMRRPGPISGGCCGRNNAAPQPTLGPPGVIEIRPVDRETARRNMTAGLIAGGFSAVVFALCFIVALLYIAHG